MANRCHRSFLASGCLLLFLGFQISSTSPLTSVDVRSLTDRSAGRVPSMSMEEFPCSKGPCGRGCGPGLVRTKRSNSLPLLLLTRNSDLPPPLSHRGDSVLHLLFRDMMKQQGVSQLRDLTSDVVPVSSEIGSDSEDRNENSWEVEGETPGDTPGESEDMEEQQSAKRFAFRKKYPPRKSPAIKQWPRQTWRNFQLGKRRLTPQVAAVKRQDGVDASSRSSSPVGASAQAASPHRWSVMFIGKRPYKLTYMD